MTVRRAGVQGPWIRRLPVLVAAVMATAALYALFLDRPARAIAPGFDTPSMVIDDTAAAVHDPEIAATAAGVLHAAWLDERSGNVDLYASRSLDNGTTWSPAVRVDNTPAPLNIFDMDLAVTPSGNRVYAIYTDSRNGDPDVFVATSGDGGQTWTPGVRVDDAPPGAQAFRPALAVESSGVVHAVWEDWRNLGSPYQIYHAASQDAGASWSTAVRVSASSSGRIAAFPSVAAADSVVQVVWKEGGPGYDGMRAARSSDGGAAWSLSWVDIGGGGESFSAPDVTASASGATLFATWTSFQGGRQVVELARSDDSGGNWSTPVRVDDAWVVPSAYPEDPTVSLIAGRPYVVWTDIRTTESHVFASGSSDGGVTWGDCPVPCLQNNDPRVDDSPGMQRPPRPASASSPLGLYAVWEDDRAGRDIRFARHMVSEILITEFRDAPDTQEVVELFNFGVKPVDLSAYELLADGIPFDLGALGTLSPGAHRTVGNWAGADLRPAGFSLGQPLLDQGGTIEVRRSGVVADAVRFGQRGPAPDPLTTVSTARALVGTTYLDSWALDLTPSFGSPNVVGRVFPAPDLILNEAFYDASDPATRFVEVLYRGPSSLNTGGFHLVGNTVYTVPLAQGVTLIPENALTSLTPPGVFYSPLLVTGDNLYLYDPSWNLLDEVGWSVRHPQGTSLCRNPEGGGSFDGFDDLSSAAAGWQVGCAPTPPRIGLGPTPQSLLADVGEVAHVPLTVTNMLGVGDYLDLTATSADGWRVDFYDAADAAALGDSPLDADGVPDTGWLGNGQALGMTARVSVGPPSVGDGEQVFITATASASSASKTALLDFLLWPFLSPRTALFPDTVNVNGTGGDELAFVTLEVVARGSPVPEPMPIDVVFQIDSSGSMAQNDPFDARKNGVKVFLEELGRRDLGDRAAILDFDDDCAWTGPDHHLDTAGHDGNPDYGDPQADVDQIDSAGSTDLACAVWDANAELISRGDPGHAWIEILLTDGVGGDAASVRTAAAEARNNGIRIYTIGLLGNGQVDELLLQDVARISGGRYYPSADPASLLRIFLEIAADVNGLTATDPWPAHRVSMVEAVLPPYIAVDPASFTVPGGSVETNALPDCDPVPECRSGPALPWNVSQLSVGETWSVSFLVRCSLPGTHPLAVYPDSRVTYLNWSGGLVSVPFPAVPITCVVPPEPLPPRNLTSTWNGDVAAPRVSLSWAPPAVLPDHYLLYRVADDPRGFTDLGTGSPDLVARLAGSDTSWADPTPIASPGEWYYLLRSADWAEGALSGTSNTAGLFVGRLDAGRTAVSRPLEHFPWVDYSGNALDTLGEHASAFGATIEYLDAGGAWRSVPGGGDPSAVLAVGRGYVAVRATAALSVFTGLPGTMIAFDDGGFAGFGLGAEARSMAATVSGDDLLLTFAQPAGMAGGEYEVWTAPGRTGMFDGSAARATPAVPAPATAVVTVTVAGGAVRGGEQYFWVVPLNASGAAGSPTYSLGVWTATYAAHDTFALPLRPLGGPRSLGWYAQAMPRVLGMVWLASPSGVWVPHLAAMASGAYDAAVVMGGGYQVAVSGAPTTFLHIGW